MSEANDSLHSTAYIKVLDLVSEGPIKAGERAAIGLFR